MALSGKSIAAFEFIANNAIGLYVAGALLHGIGAAAMSPDCLSYDINKPLAPAFNRSVCAHRAGATFISDLAWPLSWPHSIWHFFEDNVVEPVFTATLQKNRTMPVTTQH